MEIWKPVNKYEGCYEVSNFGRVRSVKHANTNGKIIKQILDKDGYFKVCLSKNNKKKTPFVHRLVAEVFVNGKTEDNPVINHKDENKQNNIAENLEWCSVKYNTNYNGGAFRRGASRKKPVVCLNTRKTYLSATDASKETGTSRSNLVSCLTGNRPSAGGLEWAYL